MAPSKKHVTAASFAALFTTFGLALTPTTAAHAAPDAAPAPSDVQAQIVQMQHDLETVTEQYNDAKIALDQQNAALATATSTYDAANVKLESLKAQVAKISVGVYKGPQMASLTTVMTSGSPAEVLDKLNTLDAISAHNNTALGELASGEAQAAAAKSAATEAADAAAKTEQDISAKKASIESELPKLETQLASLNPTAYASVMAASGGPAVASATAGTGGSAAAQGAVSAALSRLGMPYVWAASGPNSFDCSGLTMWAYGQVGIGLPHSSSAQRSSGPSVSLSALVPGDLVFMPGHVGMYIGNGNVVHAPTSGDVVKVVPLSSMHWTSAGRPAA
ncbi:cell wall-associated NlpC family hydrolase [Antricoccus suffuscus]|uniref:Cell wall-associated NlpC family hydrolase n=1 Tax=Antricoccus suffuscus TaxID=1629062 RepID=A0A2T0ZYD5_9ACTN|nr:NlpC/P60 family protein [Antricoccus suffuscus]PRZ41366.1 cell wall-associated NlpC family hydrolase [Antricoccus suffuscus]